MKKLFALSLFAVLFAIPAQAQEVTGNIHTCNKTISFAAVYPDGVVRSYIENQRAAWLRNWVKKNTKKYPDICFTQQPLAERDNFSIVFSESRSQFVGLQAAVVTNTTDISGTGRATDQYGGTWRFTYDGTVTTNSTVLVPYEISSREIFAVAFDSKGNIVGDGHHLYSAATGGAPGFSAGYNITTGLMAINARGRMLSSVINQIEGKR